MDQDSGKGTDKRNWRERLGIGATPAAQPARDLPRISDGYQPADPAPRAPAAPKAGATVKPAPMAPRPAPRPASAAPVPPDKLAERLRSQRDAQAKLAEQRVQVARQRTEVPTAPMSAPAANPIVQPRVAVAPPKPASEPPVMNAQPAAPAGARPKFTFAEEEAQQNARPISAPPPYVPPPVVPAASVPPLSPPRQPLGASTMPPVFQPRNPPVAPPPVQQPPLGRPGTMGNFGAGYPQQPMPGYRPVDPATGYPPAQGYTPPPQRPLNNGFGPVAGQQGGQNGFAPQPRLNVPVRPGLNPNLQMPQDPAFAPQQGGFAPDPRMAPPRMGRPAMPPQAPVARHPEEMADEGFYADEIPAPRATRRPAAAYQQAYRDMEQGFEEEETPRSRGPWILLALLLVALAVAAAGVWFYQTSVKPAMTSQGGTEQQVPVVEPPAGQDKVQPQQPAQADPAAAATGNKKRIYDRIVGDQEVLGGDMAAPEEVPVAPAPANDALPGPDSGAVAPDPGTGDDAAPLPIPPPPGDGNTQGSLDGNQDPQKSAAVINPAADESQAAVVPSDAGSTSGATGTVAPASAPAAEADPGNEDIGGMPAPPVVKKKAAPAAKPKKPVVAKKDAGGNLGSKPVVLVPPAKKAKSAASTPQLDEPAVVTGGAEGDLFGDGTATQTPAVPAAVPPVKKKKTLADLFNGSSTDTNADAQVAELQTAPEETPVVAAPAPKPKPAPVQTATAASNGAYVAQLASFTNKQDASAEYARLKAKHGALLSGLSPIISTAEVAGTTRYRLSVGSLASKDQANSFCAKLFAAGERDCIVKQN